MPKQESAQKADPGQEFFFAAPAGTRTRDLSITSPSLSHRATPAPQMNTKPVLYIVGGTGEAEIGNAEFPAALETCKMYACLV